MTEQERNAIKVALVLRGYASPCCNTCEHYEPHINRNVFSFCHKVERDRYHDDICVGFLPQVHEVWDDFLIENWAGDAEE